MSYTTFYSVRSDGQLYAHRDVRNGFRGAPRIWHHIGLTRMGDASLWHSGSDGWFQRMREACATDVERICFEYTADRVIISRDQILPVVAALREMHELVEHNSLDQHADALVDMLEIPILIGACVNHTSVEDVWSTTVPVPCPTCGSNELDEDKPYSIFEPGGDLVWGFPADVIATEHYAAGAVCLAGQ